MRELTAATQRRLEAGELVARDFVWVGARRRTTGALAERGWWSDAGTIDAEVIDETNTVRTRTFIGQGDLGRIDAVPLVSGFVAQEVTVRLSMVSIAVAEAVREWDVRRAPILICRGFLDPVSRLMPEPAVRRFFGFVDDAEIATPAEGQDGSITLQCASLSQELLRSSTAKRSDADQRRRAPGDRFYRHAAVVGDWEVEWGSEDNFTA